MTRSMSGKLQARIAADALMAVVLPFLMTYSLFGEEAHEWLGALMLILLVIHNLFNAEWYGRLAHGRRTPYRAVQAALTVLLLVGVLGAMASGVILSRYVFAGLPLPRSLEQAQMIHLFCAYWSFVLMSLHLGLNWNVVLGFAVKMRRAPLPRPPLRTLRALAALIAVYGAFAFFKNDFLSFLLLRTHFVFWSDTQTLGTAVADYLAVMEMLVFAGYYAGKGLRSSMRTKRT